jgi:thymidylate synthase
VGDFIWTGGDCHLYSNHLEQAKLQLQRETLPLATLKIDRKPDSLYEYCFEDFEFLNYQCHPAIKAPIAI